MHFLRTLSIRDVGAALRRRQYRLALHVTHNLCGNAVNNIRYHLTRRASEQAKQAVRGAV